MIAGFILLAAPPLRAQSPAPGWWVQLEAHPTFDEAQTFARDYAARFDNVGGFALPTGWYALALGPYDARDAALSVLGQLRARGAIPSDAFVLESASYGRRVWPPSGQDGSAGGTDEGRPPRAAGNDTALPAADSKPEPEPEPEPQETLAEARRAEARLGREARAQIQRALRWQGFYEMAIDAAFGPGTRGAMADWQSARGHEPTGVLTTRQREELLAAYREELALIGLETVRDETAGIEIELPMAMVAFDRYDPPFAHYDAVNGSGVRVLLISQEGSRASLFGLYEIMQTLEIVPPEGPRERRDSSFTLTGRSADLRSHTYAQLNDGMVKGFTLVWPPEQDRRMERVLDAMRESFAPFGDALASDLGGGLEVARRDLIAGLEVRRPASSQSGFYVDATGRVVTALDGLAQCSRVTLEESYDAEITMRDSERGLALLEPREPLSPLAFAEFRREPPRRLGEIAVAGFAYGELLTDPTLTYGALAGLEGLGGDPALRRLDVAASPGEAGGPVFDEAGLVLGMLLPRDDNATRRLPQDVHHALGYQAIAESIESEGLTLRTASREAPATPAQLSRRAADMTVLVSCWN
ncbi:peptidoglycan-binding protein [Rhodobacteraceae bacterium WD3A24]|nr:peptidoglycan-binding protein [Rhodobacteraceae bacterium WD3A24]